MKTFFLAKRSTTALLAIAALTFAASTLPRASHAQSASVPRQLAGTWVLHGDAESAMRTVDAAFWPTVSTLPEIMHGMARDRIRANMTPPRRVLVTLDGSRVRVRLEAARTSVIAGPVGSPATTSGVEPGTVVTPRLQAGWLELLYEGEGSSLRQLFSTEPDGSRMHVDYTVTGPMLRGQVRYRLDYVHP
ncbi:MAG: hypothetical protein M5U28_50565 [Sandaracinaceae bacterium]|nr:hypothetical protein [Sandaracinaceae bacterium]